LDSLASTGQVFHHPTVAAMQAGSWLMTEWAQSAAGYGRDMEHELTFSLFHPSQF
jgi:hypothetical protein